MGPKGFVGMMTREHTVFVAQLLLEDCPAARSPDLANLLVKYCSEGQVHQAAKEGIRKLQARRSKAECPEAKALDQAIFKLLIQIPRKTCVLVPSVTSCLLLLIFGVFKSIHSLA